MRQMGNKQQG